MTTSADVEPTGTHYAGHITLPTGISFSTSIYVPAEAAHPDQDELAGNVTRLRRS